MINIPISVRPLFIAAGWNPGRKVPVAAHVPSDHPAASILAEFGGLKVGRAARGEECAAADVLFQRVAGDSLVHSWSELLKTDLVGIGTAQNSHGELYVDDEGRWFEVSLMDGEFYFAGSSFGEAMERLLLGRRLRPMLRPGQDRISMYGEVVTADDARVYKYR